MDPHFALRCLGCCVVWILAGFAVARLLRYLRTGRDQ